MSEKDYTKVTPLLSSEEIKDQKSYGICPKSKSYSVAEQQAET